MVNSLQKSKLQQELRISNIFNFNTIYLHYLLLEKTDKNIKTLTPLLQQLKNELKTNTINASPPIHTYIQHQKKYATISYKTKLP